LPPRAPVPVALPLVAIPPLALPLDPPAAEPVLLAVFPMSCTVLPLTVPLSELVAMAVVSLNELVNVPTDPLLSAVDRTAEAIAGAAPLLVVSLSVVVDDATEAGPFAVAVDAPLCAYALPPTPSRMLTAPAIKVLFMDSPVGWDEGS
jgi:hypothetical protein